VACPTVDIVIPVLNEERCIERSVRTLSSYLESHSRYEWRITVADNGSSDSTWEIVQSLAQQGLVRALHLHRIGRGHALKKAWSTSTADFVAYMDADLSTRLDDLWKLIDPLVEGTADVSIGSRLAPGAQIHRSSRREVISRIYNAITRVAFRFGVKDAQCGFKALRTDTARALLPHIVDDAWFFDTELLVLARRAGFTILEVPVHWEEDLDSRVRIVRTAIGDLRGIWRLVRQPKPRRWPHDGVALSDGPTEGRDPTEQPTSFDFDALAPTYVTNVDESVSFTGRNSAFFANRKVGLLEQIAAKSVGELSSLSVLDVGCGTGTTSRFLVDRCQSLVGVDVSKEMLDQAAKTVPEASFTWYGGEELPFPDGQFDVVLAVCVLHHVTPAERRSFVAELHRVARPGGLVALFEHNPYNPLTRRAVSSCELDHGVVLLSQGDTRRLLQAAGVRSVRAEFLLFTPLGGRIGASIDHMLRQLPMGGQYVAYGIARA